MLLVRVTQSYEQSYRGNSDCDTIPAIQLQTSSTTMEHLSLVLSIVAVFIAIGYYLTRNRNIFKKYGIPYTQPWPILGNMQPIVFRQQNLLELTDDLYNAHRDARYFGFFDFLTPIVVVCDPELIKSVTVKNFDSFQDHRLLTNGATDPLLSNMLFSLTGERWKSMRSVLSPAFTSSKIKGMHPLMSSCAENIADYLSEGNRELELKSLCGKYTVDVIASCAFGITTDSIKNPNNAFYVNGRKAMFFNGFVNAVKLLLIRHATKLSTLLRVRLIKKSVAQFFQELITTTVNARDEQGIQRADILQLLIEARNRNEPGKELDMKTITIHAFTFFFGSFDTISTTLSFIFHELAANPDVQEKLQREIDRVLEERNGQLSYDAVHSIQYLDAVINEVMRSYPLGAFLDRMCVKDFELPPAVPGAKPFVVKAGTNLWFPIGAIQTDPKYFEDPKKFDPERFVADGKRIINSGTFMPFGAGPRMCIGNRFALTNMKTLICNVLARCDVKCSSRTKIPLKIGPNAFDSMPKDGFWVKFQARKNPQPVVRTPVTNGTCKVGGDK